MNFTGFTFLLVLIFFSILLIPSCTSSSGTIRYGNTNSDIKNSEDDISNRAQNENYSLKDTVVNGDEEEVPEYQDPGDLPDDETPLNLTEIIKKIEEEAATNQSDLVTASKRDLILMEIIKYLNTPYKFGGNSFNGIDCSAFTQNVYHNTNFYDLNRSAREQFKQGIEIKDKSELKFGDLVFFNTRRRVKPGHVGIYIGDNLFAHASSKLGVTISSLDHDYYSKRYMGARRYDFENELGK